MNERNEGTLQSAALWLVGVNFVAVVLHSVAHEVLSVRVTPAHLAFIAPVIIVAPVAAGFMLPKRRRAGSALLLFSTAGSFVFGLHYHFVADTIDHIAHVARLEPAFWSAAFRATACLPLAAEAPVAAAAAGLLLGGAPRPFKSYAARTDF